MALAALFEADTLSDTFRVDLQRHLLDPLFSTGNGQQLLQMQDGAKTLSLLLSALENDYAEWKQFGYADNVDWYDYDPKAEAQKSIPVTIPSRVEDLKPIYQRDDAGFPIYLMSRVSGKNIAESLNTDIRNSLTGLGGFRRYFCVRPATKYKAGKNGERVVEQFELTHFLTGSDDYGRVVSTNLHLFACIVNVGHHLIAVVRQGSKWWRFDDRPAKPEIFSSAADACTPNPSLFKRWFTSDDSAQWHVSCFIFQVQGSSPLSPNLLQIWPRGTNYASGGNSRNQYDKEYGSDEEYDERYS